MSAILSAANISPMIAPAMPSVTPSAAMPSTKTRNATGTPTQRTSSETTDELDELAHDRLQ